MEDQKITSENLDLIMNEFDRTRNLLSEIEIKRSFDSKNSEERVDERKNYHILTISSISLGIIGVVFPVIFNSAYQVEDSKFFEISLYLFSFVSITGTISAIVSFYTDKKNINDKSKKDSNYINLMLKNTVDIYCKARDKNVSSKDLENYFRRKDSIKKKIYFVKNSKIKELLWFASYLDFYIIFLGVFLLGIFIFLFSLISRFK